MKMRKIGLILLPLLLVLSMVPTVMGGSTGGIRIEPPLPYESGSDATFTVYVIPSAIPTYDPYILLVITESCHDAGISVSVDGDDVLDWEGPETDPSTKIPPSASDGAGYTVASLKDHLETTEDIYWAFQSINDGNALEDTSIEIDITATFNCADPKMLVYIMGKSENPDGSFDRRVPPTIPGFMIPELPLGTMMAVASMMVALILVVRKRPTIFK